MRRLHNAAGRAVQCLDLAFVRRELLYYRMEVRELVGPSLLWTQRPQTSETG
jgi:hypothetical protein